MTLEQRAESNEQLGIGLTSILDAKAQRGLFFDVIAIDGQRLRRRQDEGITRDLVPQRLRLGKGGIAARGGSSPNSSGR